MGRKFKSVADSKARESDVRLKVMLESEFEIVESEVEIRLFLLQRPFLSESFSYAGLWILSS